MIARAVNRLRREEPELLLLLLILLACLVIGLATVGQYGASWDEPDIYRYADESLSAYRFFFHPEKLTFFDTVLSWTGPSYFMAARLLTYLPGLVSRAWSGPVGWHCVDFLSFLACVVLLYLFSRRWLHAPASLGMSVLFASQPLFWGHAFINPKDLAFMALFLGSVELGFHVADRYADSRPSALLVVAAAMLLGLATSFRPSAPLAGAIVAVYAMSRLRWKSLPILLAYAALAMAVAYLTWPFLWGAPLAKFLESLRMMSKFPFPTKVLFMGKYYAGNALPWYFYPVMLGIQWTLPLLALVLAGLGVAVHRFVRHGGAQRQPLLLFAGWFLLPAVAIIAGNSTLYDNGRQLFFLLPPVLLLAGLALDALFKWLHAKWIMAGLVVLLMLPGLYGILRLHPYEYIYYNQLVGGTGGAYGQYEIDYWGTSYREAALWLNEHAAPGSKLWVTGPSMLLQLYLRPDLVLSCDQETDCGMHYDYIVTLARWKAERQCAGAKVAFTIERRGALLSVVRQLPLGQTCH